MLEKDRETSWAERVLKETAHSVNVGRIILHTVQRKANWTGSVLRRNCLIKRLTEGKI